MEETARTSRPTSALVVLLCAALIASVGFAERADSKRFSTKQIRSVSKKRLAGAYSGVSEEGTAVSFRLTRRGKVVDFVAPITLACETDVGDLNGDGTFTYDGGEISKTTKPVTLTAPPLAGRGRTAHYPLGMKFEYASPSVPSDQPPLGTQIALYDIKASFKSLPVMKLFKPTPKSAAVIEGQAGMGTVNGPPSIHAPGREVCNSIVNGFSKNTELDFEAKRTGG